jgi:hypothetical protein
MHANAYQELVLANQTYHAGDFEGALRHSTKAEEYYDFIGELEMKQKAGLLSTSLRDLVGIKPQGATPPKQAASKIPDIGPYLEKFKKLNPLVAGGILVFVMVVFLLLVLSTYFWTLSKRRTLNVKELNRVSYGRRLGNDEQPESKPRPEATSATAQQPIQPSSRQAKTIERYATGANEVQTQIHKESIDSSAIKRRRPTVEKYKTGDETVGSNEDSSDDIFVKHTPNVSPFTVEPHALSTLNGKPSPNGAQRYSTTSEVGRIEFSPKSRLFDSTTIKEDKATQLSPNKGIMRIKVCRLGLCVKPKISRRGGLGRYSRRIN